MGRKNQRGGRKGGDRKGGGNRKPRVDTYRSNPDIPKNNEKLEAFYNGLLPLDDAEKTDFWETLRRDLPNSFRFCGSKGHALAVKRLLETRYAPEINKIEHFNGDVVQAPQPVPWYPDQLAYSMTTPKQVVRKFPPFASFQKFLVSETSVGNISRQELVSMIPPLVMDLKPGMTVLDLCAAPGSKSAQLLEMIHSGEEARIRKFMESFGEAALPANEQEEVDPTEDSSDDGRATGLLVANDVEYKRCHLLVHQLKRLSSPNLIVTNHDATLFPSFRIGKDPENPNVPRYLKYDRILADVPCSGDGTLRKNVDLWRNWQPGNALGLHATQARILVRALQMLKVGGRVVYSTCSMNPVENESVVVSAIERCGGPDVVEIIDCKDRLPLLKRYPGMYQWQVMDKSGRIWNSWAEVEHHVLNGGQAPGKISQTMFPRPDTSDCSGLPLDRCMRVYPHQQDTGGFFITVLEKKKDFKAKDEVKSQLATAAASPNGASAPEMEIAEEVKAVTGEPTDEIPSIGSKRSLEEESEQAPDNKRQRTETPTNEKVENITAVVRNTEAAKVEDSTESPAPNASTDKRVKRMESTYEEPFKYLPADHEVVQNIRNFYKLSARFPSDRFMVRNAVGEPAKAIYYSSQLVREILVENEGRGVRFIHGGLKMFMKQDAPSAEVCRWRIQSEGLPIIAGYMGPERIVRLTNKDTLHMLLKEMFPKFIDDGWKKLNEIGERTRDIGMGCCLLSIEPDGSDPEFSEPMVLPLWKSFHSLNLMLPKEDRAAMMLRLFNDTSPVINRTLKDSAKLEAEAAGSDAKQEVQEEAPDADMENAIPTEDAENAPTPENEAEAAPDPSSEAPEVPS
ncbi:S-adenosyl-L-methionine-dependent methyltransferase [Xylaria bambusicola]|uniref:S-adenosyl-L-methionine-dependent methyltransferase n=1 Tax=Xylaria bambusicola TaxID=326684 RepID=UPI0020074D4D|nr:S-adenosyl-L-methionine-dependent methyltransferase [Xylaria bambusicola]KAI0509263.1 S-adenosyl-L-methionine-dependent methyltransferase [Xylaria bambusicola]